MEQGKQKKIDLSKRGFLPMVGNIQGFGKIAVMQDGTRYLITDKGWKKIIKKEDNDSA